MHKTYFKKNTNDGIVENKTVWKFIKAFFIEVITNKTTCPLKKDDDKIVSEEKDFVETFNNNNYINVAENSSGIKPSHVAL